ncbi:MULTISPECIES: oligopeptide:H+ symporter [unclassified Bifidobacterium]|uniref:oligopeptide:H+ symporter n=1 Tax=unclassified Bifidobacterium TaxID=2608897 RepID=UPI0023F9444D|nr:MULTISPECIES: oligopeptide:H+ symporter [unclassified Bifidobacterium]WEV65255.1 oligopeptide:H+ symporter [Bifidobacterium sp. ESL0764]WEV75942.1 oligopeptide:H+ symporter [Bifidobacterium sp. ESL0800]
MVTDKQTLKQPDPAKTQDEAVEKTQEEKELDELRSDRSFLGYPKGIASLAAGNFFNSICWGAYGAVMIYYLYKPWTQGLGFTQGEAAQLIAIVGAINSMFGIVGSWLADRVFGARKALVIGNITKGLSCGILAIPAFSLSQGRVFALVGMILMNLPIMGASNASLTGLLFKRDDSRRDGAFAVHTIANNIAGFITPIIAAQLGLINYHYGFAIGAVAAFLYAAAIAIPGRRFFGSLGEKPSRPLSTTEKKKYSIIAVAAVVVIAVIVAIVFAMHKATIGSLANTISSCTFIIAIVFFAVIWKSKRIQGKDRMHVAAISPIIIMQIVIGVDYAVQGTTLLMFLDQRINRNFFGIEIAPGSFQTVVAVIALIAGVFYSWLWATKLGAKWKSVDRLWFGYIFQGISNLLLIVPTVMLNPSIKKYSVFWILLYYVVSNLGGFPYAVAANSAIAAAAPKSYETQLQTGFTLAASIGTAISLVLFGKLTSLVQQLPLFLILGICEIVVAVVIIVFRKKMSNALLS